VSPVLDLNRTLVPEESGLAHSKKTHATWVTPLMNMYVPRKLFEGMPLLTLVEPCILVIIYLPVHMQSRLGMYNYP
jgi:hypothetical protein